MMPIEMKLICTVVLFGVVMCTVSAITEELDAPLTHKIVTWIWRTLIVIGGATVTGSFLSVIWRIA